MPDEGTATATPLDELDIEGQAAAEAEGQPAQPAGTPPEPAQPAELTHPILEKYGNDPVKAFDALQHAQSEIGRLGNEVGRVRELEERLGHYERTYQEPPALAGHGQQAPQQQQQPTREQLEELAEEDPAAYAEYLVQMGYQQAVSQFEERIAPLYKAVNAADASSTMERLKSEFGDATVHEHKDSLRQAIEADQEYFLDPSTRYERLRRTVAAAEYEKIRNGQQPAPPAPAAGAVHVEGASHQGQPPAPQNVDPLIAEIDNVGTHRDAFGGVPGR